MSDLTAKRIEWAESVVCQGHRAAGSPEDEASGIWEAREVASQALTAYADLLRVRERHNPRAVGGLGPHAEDDL
jgi:hypothetical protein